VDLSRCQCLKWYLNQTIAITLMSFTVLVTHLLAPVWFYKQVSFCGSQQEGIRSKTLCSYAINLM